MSDKRIRFSNGSEILLGGEVADKVLRGLDDVTTKLVTECALFTENQIKELLVQIVLSQDILLMGLQDNMKTIVDGTKMTVEVRPDQATYIPWRGMNDERSKRVALEEKLTKAKDALNKVRCYDDGGYCHGWDDLFEALNESEE